MERKLLVMYVVRTQEQGDRNMTEEKHMLYPLADALSMDFSLVEDRLKGNKKTKMDLFEGYSPTIVSSIVRSLTHFSYGVTGVLLQVWGNLHVVLVNEDKTKQLFLFVLDRSKMREAFPKSELFENNKWSRGDLYLLMEPGLKAIYYRSSYNTQWKRLGNDKQRLKAYNAARREGKDATVAWDIFWDGGKA